MDEKEKAKEKVKKRRWMLKFATGSFNLKFKFLFALIKVQEKASVKEQLP